MRRCGYHESDGPKNKEQHAKAAALYFSRLERPPVTVDPSGDHISERARSVPRRYSSRRRTLVALLRRDLQLARFYPSCDWVVEGFWHWLSGWRERDRAAGGARSADPVLPTRARPLPAGFRWRSRMISSVVLAVFSSLEELAPAARMDSPPIWIAFWPWVRPCCLKRFRNRSQRTARITSSGYFISRRDGTPDL